MNKITNMYVVQGRGFAPDVIPYRFIITAFGTNLFKETLGFRDSAWSQENGDYVFQDGTFVHEGETVPITWLGFNEHRIVIQVLGTSDSANALYRSLRGMLAEIAPGFQEVAPVLFNEETSCTARLDFEWPALLNPALVDQVTRRAQEFSTDETKRVIKGVTIRFTLGAVITSENLSAYDFTLTDQTIAIEPKAGVPLSEQLYFTYSPCNSDTHIQLVSELERSLSKGRRKGRS